MKIDKFFIIALSFLLLISCDPPIYFDTYIKNNCNDTIEVKCEAGAFKAERENITIVVLPLNTVFLYQKKDILGFSKKDINIFIKQLEIKKIGCLINFNPLDDLDRWTFEQLSQDSYKSVLTVYPEDFE